jgi:hypothetical protein
MHGLAKVKPNRADAQEVDFDLKRGGSMIIKATLQMPARLTINEPAFVGAQSVPVHKTNFDLFLPDRHALTFADYDKDGKQDAQMVTGGLGGGIDEPRFAGKVFDPTYIYQNGRYIQDITGQGKRKSTCRGRQGASVDANGDGLVDFFESCESAAPIINIQTPKGWNMSHLPKAAAADQYRWLQSGKSPLPKLLALSDKRGASLWTLNNHHWHRLDSAKLRGGAGQTTLGDYNGNGQPDIFVSNHFGSTLLSVNGKKLKPHNPYKLGLPAAGTAAAFVDANNDGRLDLESIPQGLSLQKSNEGFKPTDKDKFRTAEGHIAEVDFDNDGDREPLIGASHREFAKRAQVYVKDSHSTHNSGWLEIDVPGELQTSRMIVTNNLNNERYVAWAGESNTARFSEGHNRVYVTDLPKAAKLAKVTLETPDGKRYSINTPINRVVNMP